MTAEQTETRLRALRAGLDADPTYTPTLDSGALCDTYNAPGPPVPRPIPIPRLRQWCADSGLRRRVENFARAQALVDAAAQSPAYDVCLTLQDTFWGTAEPFDPLDPHNVSLMGKLVAAALSTAEEVRGLAMLNAVPGPSKAQLIPGWNLPVQPPDIDAARSP